MTGRIYWGITIPLLVLGVWINGVNETAGAFVVGAVIGISYSLMRFYFDREDDK